MYITIIISMTVVTAVLFILGSLAQRKQKKQN